MEPQLSTIQDKNSSRKSIFSQALEMFFVIMTVDITSHFFFVYNPFQISLYLLSVPAGEGQCSLLQKELEMNSICFKKYEKQGV